MSAPVLSPALSAYGLAWQAALDEEVRSGPPASGAAWLQVVRTAGVLYDGRPLCDTRQPMVIDAQVEQAYRRVIGALRIAVRAARELLLEDGLDGRPDSLAVRIGVEAGALALARMDPGYPSAAILARADSYLSRGADGRLRPQLLELNAESPAGMAYNDALAALTLADPLTSAGGQPLAAYGVATTAAQAVLATWRTWRPTGAARPTGSGAPTVAIVDRPGVPTAPEFALFQQVFEALGVRCLVVDAPELSFDGQRLWAGDEAIDLVYRRLLVADVLAAPQDSAALMDACRVGAVCVVNSFRSCLLHNKGLFALFFDPVLRHRLPSWVLEVLDESVPWTGLLTPGDARHSEPLRERALQHPQDWVLKPLTGHGGAGVMLGWQADARSWARAVADAQAHVLQRRVAEFSLPFPDARQDHMLTDRVVSLDPFLVCGRLAGFLCRLSAGPLANIAAGQASQIPVLRLGPPASSGEPGPLRDEKSLAGG